MRTKVRDGRYERGEGKTTSVDGEKGEKIKTEKINVQTKFLERKKNERKTENTDGKRENEDLKKSLSTP